VFRVVLLWNDVYLHYFDVEKVGEDRGWTEKQCNGGGSDRVRRGIEEV